jgi:hypothetical protein
MSCCLFLYVVLVIAELSFYSVKSKISLKLFFSEFQKRDVLYKVTAQHVLKEKVCNNKKFLTCYESALSLLLQQQQQQKCCLNIYAPVDLGAGGPLHNS